jgi:hypothetical protein
MSFRYRIAIGLLGLVVLALFAGGFVAVQNLEESYTADRNSIAYQYDGENDRTISECFRRRNIVAISDCIQSQSASNQEAQISYQYLKAQQHMSLVALSMLVISLISMLLTAVGAFFVWQTIIDTRRIGFVQSSAYVSLTNSSLCFTNELERTPVAFFTFKNTGATLAENFDYSARLTLTVKGEDHPAISIELDRNPSTKHVNDIPPSVEEKRKSYSINLRITDDIWNELKNRNVTARIDLSFFYMTLEEPIRRSVALEQTARWFHPNDTSPLIRIPEARKPD